MLIFGEDEIGQYLNERRRKLYREVRDADEQYVARVDEREYAAYLLERFRIEPLLLRWDETDVTDSEEVTAPNGTPTWVVTYHVPFSGEQELLRLRPSHFILWKMDVDVTDGEVQFRITGTEGDTGAVKRRADEVRRNTQRLADNLAEDVETFNRDLEQHATGAVAHRKQQLSMRATVLNSLGVPVRKVADVPVAFTLPIAPKKPVVRPATTEGISPEWFLDDCIYHEILRIMYQTGIAMEQHPSIYAGKGEEALRDHFLMMLAPHFESATGETFNRSGRTDILIRHEGKNVFIAECLVWHGRRAFTRKIDQALRYLTWRDSKAAVICFVRTKAVQKVVDQIGEEAGKHPCFIRSRGKEDDGWLNFDFRLEGDPERGVQFAALCFHFPR